MPYNEIIAERVEETLFKMGVECEVKKMFGGLCFMYRGKMATGIVKDDLMVRCLPIKMESMLEQNFVREMDFTGKPLKGFLYIEQDGFKSDEELIDWLSLGIEYVDSILLNPKK